jgi:ribosomal RNA assembly protein
MAEYLKVPKDRVGVLVGKDGRTKSMLEKKCKVRLDIGQEGGVSIVSPDEDGYKEWRALGVVKAIGRGFNPKYAIQVLKEGHVLSIINLYDVLNRKDSDLKRVKGRVIGEKGKAWRTIEGLTNTRMAVYGRTIGIIGMEEDVDLCERGIQMIIDGARHQSVYSFLEKEGSKRIGL